MAEAKAYEPEKSLRKALEELVMVAIPLNGAALSLDAVDWNALVQLGGPVLIAMLRLGWDWFKHRNRGKRGSRDWLPLSFVVVAVTAMSGCQTDLVALFDRIEPLMAQQAELRQEYREWRELERDIRQGDDDARLEQVQRRIDMVQAEFDRVAEILERRGWVVEPLEAPDGPLEDD